MRKTLGELQLVATVIDAIKYHASVFGPPLTSTPL
jgi:hypothetical protein